MNMRAKFVVLLFAVTVLAGVGLAWANSSSATASVSVHNPAVFLTLAQNFPNTALDISSSQIAQGCVDLSSSLYNVDATSTWSLSVSVSQVSVPQGVSAENGNLRDAVQLGTQALCPGNGFSGGGGLEVVGASTAGTPGTDVQIFAALFFASPGINFTAAVPGLYSFAVQANISDI